MSERETQSPEKRRRGGRECEFMAMNVDQSAATWWRGRGGEDVVVGCYFFCVDIQTDFSTTTYDEGG